LPADKPRLAYGFSSPGKISFRVWVSAGKHLLTTLPAL
jgi:hypothetical protein